MQKMLNARSVWFKEESYNIKPEHDKYDVPKPKKIPEQSERKDPIGKVLLEYDIYNDPENVKLVETNSLSDQKTKLMDQMKEARSEWFKGDTKGSEIPRKK